jgi:hypothetical protein
MFTVITKRETTLETKSTHNIPLPKVAGPVEAVKVATVEQIAPKPTRRWRAWVFQVYLLIARPLLVFCSVCPVCLIIFS